MFKMADVTEHDIALKLIMPIRKFYEYLNGNNIILYPSSVSHRPEDRNRVLNLAEYLFDGNIGIVDRDGTVTEHLEEITSKSFGVGLSGGIVTFPLFEPLPGTIIPGFKADIIYTSDVFVVSGQAGSKHHLIKEKIEGLTKKLGRFDPNLADYSLVFLSTYSSLANHSEPSQSFLTLKRLHDFYRVDKEEVLRKLDQQIEKYKIRELNERIAALSDLDLLS